VFVNGCFLARARQLFRPPKKGRSFGAQVNDKILKNQTRDFNKSNERQSMDWRVITVRECATKGRLTLTEDAFILVLRKAISGSGFKSTIRGEESEHRYE
jgi:G:T-mismatch repair DNA endonuclease (very short patch repair protein)